MRRSVTAVMGDAGLGAGDGLGEGAGFGEGDGLGVSLGLGEGDVAGGLVESPPPPPHPLKPATAAIANQCQRTRLMECINFRPL